MLAVELAPDHLEHYLDSMPADYASIFEAKDIRDHARIVLGRGDELVVVELWRAFPDGSSAILVVTDDRPGLLSYVGSALVASNLQVADAQAFCRQRRDGRAEAVDLFWVTAAEGGAVDAELLGGVRRTLAELIGSAEALADAYSDNPFEAPTLVTAIPLRVSFDARALRRGKHVLIVETPDVMGLMLSISSTLHRMGIAIVASDIRTNGALAHDRFTLSAADGVLDERVQAEVVERITATVQALHGIPRD